MLLRLWMLVLLVCVSAFAPSRACAHAAETRTGNFFPQLPEAHLENAPQVADWHQANPLFNYEPASGYAQAAESGGLRITSKGLARVESHLDDVLANQFGDLPRATALEFQAGERAMLGRLRSGATTSFDKEFYLHELKESARFRATGNLMDAHNAALQWRGVTPASYFHPEVIQANPTIFGPGWKP